MGKIYVGNLPYDTTDADLADLFSQKGEVVSAKVITDRFSGRSKGFGFVEMAGTDNDADAIDAFNGFEMSGRPLRVNEAIEKPRSEPRGDSRY